MKDQNNSSLSISNTGVKFVEMCSPLHMAVYNNSIEEAKDFLAQGVDPNIFNLHFFTAMHLAKSPEMVELLRSYGALEDHKFTSCYGLRDTPLEKQPNQHLVKLIKSLIPVIMWDLQHEISLNNRLQEILEQQWDNIKNQTDYLLHNKEDSAREEALAHLYVLGRAKVWLKENFEKFAPVKPTFYHYVLLELALGEAEYPVTKVDKEILHTRGDRGYDNHLEINELEQNMPVTSIGDIDIPHLEMG